MPTKTAHTRDACLFITVPWAPLKNEAYIKI